MRERAYLDASAILKLILEEPESADLARFASPRTLVSTELAQTESARAVLRRREGSRAPEADALRARAALVLAGVRLVSVDRPTLALAGALTDPHLGTLDAVHVATALRLRASLRAFVTYDRRQALAAAGFGLNLVQPGLA